MLHLISGWLSKNCDENSRMRKISYSKLPPKVRACVNSRRNFWTTNLKSSVLSNHNYIKHSCMRKQQPKLFFICDITRATISMPGGLKNFPLVAMGHSMSNQCKNNNYDSSANLVWRRCSPIEYFCHLHIQFAYSNSHSCLRAACPEAKLQT